MSKGRFAAVTAAFRDLARACVSLETAFADLDAEPVERKRPAPVESEPTQRPPKQRPIPIVATEGVTPSAARVLAALASSSHPLNRQSIAIRTGIAYKSSTLDKALAELRGEGYIETTGGANAITVDGKALAPFPDLPEGSALFDFWVERVGASAGPGKVLRAMRTHHRNGQHVLSRMDIASATGIEYKSSTLDKALAKLRSLELLQGGGSENRLVAELARAAEIAIGVFDRQSGATIKVSRKGVPL